MRHLLLFILLGGWASLNAQAATLQREVGDFDLNLGTAPSRSMAQGLIQPQRIGQVHGGFDLTHPSGWYLGQWSPSVGITPGSQLEFNSYIGYRHTFNDGMGYEIGTIRYSRPHLDQHDSQNLYAGLTFAERRLGLSFNNRPNRFDSTLLADLGELEPLGLSLVVKYGNHVLDDPVSYDGGQVRLFNDWSLSLTRPWLGIDLGLSYSDSSLSGDQCTAYVGHNLYCEGLLSFKASRSLF